MQKKLILASSSPRRQELIRSLRLPYEIIVSDVDETTREGLSPAEVVEELSLRKAAAVAGLIAARTEPGVIIGSDTIVVLEGRILGKPKDKDDAFRMLQELQGREHRVYSGVACIDAATGHAKAAHCVTEVHMKPLSDDQIRRYIQTGEPLDKAGSYGIQGLGAVFIEKIDGDYYNVVGLPLALLSSMLEELGLSVL